METKSRPNFKTVFVSLYIAAFIIYLFVGFLPAEAMRNDTYLNIPSLNLISEVITLELNNRELKTPDLIVGSFSNHDNKTLLIGHSKTVFSKLKNISLGDNIIYDQRSYQVVGYRISPKNHISMREILKTEENETLMIMTCAGQDLGGGDSTHRLIVTALLSE